MEIKKYAVIPRCVHRRQRIGGRLSTSSGWCRAGHGQGWGNPERGKAFLEGGKHRGAFLLWCVLESATIYSCVGSKAVQKYCSFGVGYVGIWEFHTTDKYCDFLIYHACHHTRDQRVSLRLSPILETFCQASVINIAMLLMKYSYMEKFPTGKGVLLRPIRRRLWKTFSSGLNLQTRLILRPAATNFQSMN